nr:UPF0380 proteins YafZ-like protein [Escherichia coli]
MITASRFAHNSIRRERPLTDDELMQFSLRYFPDKHESRSERYTYIPTINIINKLSDEGQPFLPVRVGFVI